MERGGGGPLGFPPLKDPPPPHPTTTHTQHNFTLYKFLISPSPTKRKSSSLSLLLLPLSPAATPPSRFNAPPLTAHLPPSLCSPPCLRRHTQFPAVVNFSRPLVPPNGPLLHWCRDRLGLASGQDAGRPTRQPTYQPVVPHRPPASLG